MSEQQIRIEREELFDPAVDKALARERRGRERIIADTPPVSPIRRLLLNSMIYLPVAAALGALITWWLLDPKINDRPIVSGEIMLVNADPFDGHPGIISLTIGPNEVLVDTAWVKLEKGTDGQPAFASADSLKIGDRIEVSGAADGRRLHALAIRPTSDPKPRGELEEPSWPLFLLFPLTATLIAFGLLFAEGLTTRNWIRMIERTLLGSFLAALFATLAFFPAGLMILAARFVQSHLSEPSAAMTIKDFSAVSFLVFTAGRSAAWACIGAAAGLGMNLVRSTRTQLRNSVIGGALGGALGGLFFDPIDRFFSSLFAGGGISRLVGLLAVGISIGIFVALVERLARDAWLRVRTGPLAGKSFILYKTPTIIGNSPDSDVYLYKDAEIDPSHAAIHRVGTTYEIEDMGTRMGTSVGGNKIRRRRLASGDQIVIGSTILDFEERQKRTPVA
ncbi:MAG TPA: FHA domain-containing protein [Kofleriaceae bacterium]|nr:FHA domain-containing protein [Kofleriaceae bacterium]